MRITIVSSRYPPDALGGAPVVAERLVRGFVERGHDVRVFAGSVSAGRSEGEVWDDDGGIAPVRWMDVSRWTAQNDEKSYRNHLAEERFAEFLREHPADVVHVHTPQGLGGGLVRVAAESGARTLVTMHDWWWICARQFLMDRTGRRCSPVIEAGACQCEVSFRWNEGRRAWLDQQLRYADVIFAPSKIMMESLAANGVDRARLRVDENGLPHPDADVEHQRANRLDDSLVRFLYAGGSSHVKGVHVAFGAAEKLAGVPGWELLAYGANAFIEKDKVDIKGRPIRVFPAYRPDDIGTILDAVDVLLVPTMTSESYSIITREAQLHNVPVIATDSWGPEEVIEHGVNGFIVASNDADALADAMRRLIVDRDLLDAMKRRSHRASIRTVEEQIDGLLSTYRSLCSSESISVPNPSNNDAAPRVDLQAARIADDALGVARIAGPLRIGVYADAGLGDAESALIDYMERNADAELFVLDGDLTSFDRFSQRVKRVSQGDPLRLPRLLRQLDILVVPGVVASNDDNAAARRWIDAALVRTPVIASVQSALADIIESGVNGQLAANSDEWAVELDRLSRDPHARRRIGARARRDALFHFAPAPSTSAMNLVADRVRLQVPTVAIRQSRAVEFPLPVALEGDVQLDLSFVADGGPGSALRVTVFDAVDRSNAASSEVDAYEVGDGGWTGFQFSCDRPMTSPWVRVEQRASGNDALLPGHGSRRLALWAERAGVHRSQGRAFAGGPCFRLWSHNEARAVAHASSVSLGLTGKLSARLRFARHLVRTQGISKLIRRTVGFATQRG